MVPFLFLFANSVLIDVYAIKGTEIGNHVNLSRKNPNNEVRIRRLGKQLVRKPEDKLLKSITPDGGGGTLSMTVSLTNGPAAAPSAIPHKKNDPAALPIQSKPWHMPLWGWILIGFAIFAFFLVITWVVWYYCSHRAAARTAGNQNGEMELDDIESLSSSTIECHLQERLQCARCIRFCHSPTQSSSASKSSKAMESHIRNHPLNCWGNLVLLLALWRHGT
ncbi:hypothetical protein MKW98_004210 [Papaver atlanticum]|uniref:Uncharacterized protein n=1 Tax=Papaver atlanticum TaxID=357466 RepID=A0AAD4XTF8_9MAGN|nr:hypothetical protein MKW98_004210 [Papaver atlanticum]